MRLSTATLMMIYSLFVMTSPHCILQALGREASHHHPPSRFLVQSLDKRAGCKSNRFVCLLRGSAGSDCCQNSCVNTATDRQNCGRCRNKCKYMESRCGGQCVDLMRSQKHCGRCGNRCKKGGGVSSSCAYGMCKYA